MAQSHAGHEHEAGYLPPSGERGLIGGVRISPRVFGEAISRAAAQSEARDAEQRAMVGQAPPAAPRAVGEVARLLGYSAAELDQGREVLGLCGDPLRRRIIETLAAQAGTAVGELIGQFAAGRADIDHRLATLKRRDLVQKGRFSTYNLDPKALLGVRAYFDVLVAASSRSARSPSHGD